MAIEVRIPTILRSYTNGDKAVEGKGDTLADLAAAIEAHGGRVEVEPEQADMWLAAVNDIRLVLATRLGVDDDAGTWRTQMPPDDPRLPLVAAYDWLSMLQELLVDALT